jgi:hypothetical protein
MVAEILCMKRTASAQLGSTGCGKIPVLRRKQPSAAKQAAEKDRIESEDRTLGG